MVDNYRGNCTDMTSSKEEDMINTWQEDDDTWLPWARWALIGGYGHNTQLSLVQKLSVVAWWAGIGGELLTLL